jgi:hypothetical protein
MWHFIRQVLDIDRGTESFCTQPRGLAKWMIDQRHDVGDVGNADTIAYGRMNYKMSMQSPN